MGLDMIAGIAGPIMGIAANAIGGQSQRAQNSRLMRQQANIDKEQTRFNQQMALDMWHKTGYGAQVKQMKEAGINPALMYGMGGGGGQTATVTPGNVGGARAENQSANIMQGLGMGMELALLKAQKEKLEAETEDIKASAVLKGQQQYGVGLDNALKEYLQQTDLEGNDIKEIRGSAAAEGGLAEANQKRADVKFRIDENQRQELMNNAKMLEIGEKISLMKKQGMKEGEIYKNLQKEGLLLDAEIEFNKLDISENPGKFLWHIIRTVLGQVKAR